ncbi:MAG: hypothetical protein AAF802_06295 [Planctomycetota bacterium]
MIQRCITRLVRLVQADSTIRSFVIGVPAALIACVVLTLVYSATRVKKATLAESYFLAAVEAQRLGDHDSADLWLRRVLMIRPRDRAARFHRAMNAISRGNPTKASRIISELAPEDRVGFGPAHHFVASQLIQLDRIEDDEIERRVRFHLTAALSSNPDDPETRHLAAEFELSLENLGDAIQHYDVLSRRDPSFHRLIAGLHVVRGEREAALLRLDRGRRAFEKVLQADATDVRAQIELAKLYAFSEQYDVATKMLNRLSAFQHVPEQQAGELQSTLSTIYHDWSIHVAETSPEDFNERLRLLELSIRLAPDKSRGFGTVQKMRSESEDARLAAETLIARVTADERVAATALVHLAVEAAREGKRDEERQLLELALSRQALNENMRPEKRRPLGVAANNLAWNLAQDSIELPRALQLVNEAINTSPDRIEFRATRGRILAKMDRTAEAIRELEFVAGKSRPTRSLSRSLTSLYESLDLTPNPLRDPPTWMREANKARPNPHF